MVREGRSDGFPRTGYLVPARNIPGVLPDGESCWDVRTRKSENTEEPTILRTKISRVQRSTDGDGGGLPTTLPIWQDSWSISRREQVSRSGESLTSIDSIPPMFLSLAVCCRSVTDTRRQKHTSPTKKNTGAFATQTSQMKPNAKQGLSDKKIC